MNTLDTLKKELERIDGKGYGAYKDLRGQYELGKNCILCIDQVQSDPYAPPSKVRLQINQKKAGFPKELFSNHSRRVALEDFLIRCFSREIRAAEQNWKVEIDFCGQEILERTAMSVNETRVEARFAVGLPAKGRRIMGRQAANLLCSQLPRIAEKAMVFSSLKADKLREHIQTAEDQRYLRNSLQQKGLIAFVGNGALLARASGVSDKPLEKKEAIPFYSPQEMEVEFELPNSGKIRGMGIPAGVTVIVGGGYHGKSTLLKALERGIYEHLPGDGREWVVTEPSAVKIRAEDGRAVTGVDISPFINTLPNGQSTYFFMSSNASGSTSQAANIVEALESDSRLLLVDEDTSATNFMIRDSRMQALVAKEHEPITPFIDRIRELENTLDISTIVVMGGSGDYLGEADTVIMLKNYEPSLITEQAREVVARFPQQRETEINDPIQAIKPRRIRPNSFKTGPKDKVGTKGRHTIRFGRENVEIDFVEQLVSDSQTRSIAAIMKLLPTYLESNEYNLFNAVEEILRDINEQGLELLSGHTGKHPGNLATVRRQEILSAVSRFRKLCILENYQNAGER